MYKIDISEMTLEYFLKTCAYLKNNFVLKMKLEGNPKNQKLKDRIFDIDNKNFEMDYISIDKFASEYSDQ